MCLYRKLVLVLILIFMVVATTACGKTDTASSPQKLRVVVSVYPVYEFARIIGGDKVDLTMMVPPGVEPHDWEPTAQDILLVKSARLFLYQGAGFENLGKVLNKETLGNTPAIAISHDIPLLEENHTDTMNQVSDIMGHHFDSHIWLDPVYVQQEVRNIAEALSAADPDNRGYYQDQAKNYIKELEKVDSEYKNALANLPRRDIVTSHAAFGYLTKRYNLEQIAIMGLSPDSEPTPERMVKITDFCRKHNVKYIFFETIISPKLSETIAKATGAKLLVLNPAESLTEEESRQGKTYISIMMENLENLKTALRD